MNGNNDRDPNIGNKVTDITADESCIELKFENDKRLLKLFAAADCCSYSLFMFFDKNKVINREITSIYHTGDDYVYLSEEDKENAESGGDLGTEIKINHMIVEFMEGEPHSFILVNRSNGFYCGWMEKVVV